MSFHPRSDELAETIRQCPAIAWSGKFIRSTSIDYANRRDLITGEGSQQFGGRYNPIGIRAVYGSLDLTTAIAEYLAHSRRQGLPDVEADVFPLVVIRLEATLNECFDLTNLKVRRNLNITWRQITDEPWQDLQDHGQEALTQAIGRLVREAGFDGLLFPSAANKPSGKNLVLFPDKLSSDRLRILNKEKVPPPRRKKA